MSYTYATLKQAIQDYTENTETSFVNNLPLFIRSAEERILKSVQLNLFRRNASGTMSQGNKYLRVPQDFLAPYSLSYTTSSEEVFVEFKDVSFIQTYNPDSTVTGLPKYYASFDYSF